MRKGDRLDLLEDTTSKIVYVQTNINEIVGLHHKIVTALIEEMIELNNRIGELEKHASDK
jgi:hypothetical protein